MFQSAVSARPHGFYIAAPLQFHTWRRVGILLILFCFVPLFVHSQTAWELETLLKTEAVSYAAAARLVLEAADVAAFAEPEAAFRFAAEQGWLPKQAAAGDRAKLSGISLLLMRSFDIGGGIFYSIFRNPRYAYRELVYRQVITGKSEPGMAVSGNELLLMVGRLLSLREDS